MKVIQILKTPAVSVRRMLQSLKTEVPVKGEGKVIPFQARCGPEVGRGIVRLFRDRGTRRG